MRVPTYRRPTRDETGKLEKGIELLGNSQSSQIELMTTALQRNCNFEDQFNTETIVYEAADQEDVMIYLKKIKGKPSNVVLVWTSHYSPWSYCWAVIDQSTIKVQVKWNSAPSGDAKIKLRIFGE